MQGHGTTLPISLCLILALITADPQAAPNFVIKPLPAVKSPSATINGKTPSLPPSISTLSPGGCIRPGQKLLVQGSHFGRQAGRVLLLDGPGLRLPFRVNGWADSTISATLPNDPRLRAQTYTIGIASDSQGGWLGQPVPLLRVCPVATRQANEQGRQALSRGLRLNNSATNDQAPAPLVKPTQAGEPGTSPAQAPAPPPPRAAPARPGPGQGGSLTGLALPPPPAALTTGPTMARDVEPGEITLVSADMAAARATAAQLRPYRMQVLRRYPLAGLGLVISVFRLPAGVTVAAALARLEQDLPELWLEANHRYRPLAADPLHSRRQARELIQWPATDPDCGAGLRLGMADSGIDTTHPALQGRSIRQHSVLIPGQPVVPADHGTAIASLLVGKPGSGYAGLLPGASLIAAGIFRGKDRQHLDTTSELILKALDWLAGQGPRVINLSFGGPGDRILGLAVDRLWQQGIVLVAAAGNGGDEPVYPAAYDKVIAVTAVDLKRRRYRQASAGDYIDLAAPGVDLWVARPGGDGAYQSGTSFAAPFVSASTALLLTRDPASNPLEKLRETAIDLGASGRDPHYGYGLVQAPPCMPGPVNPARTR